MFVEIGSKSRIGATRHCQTQSAVRALLKESVTPLDALEKAKLEDIFEQGRGQMLVSVNELEYERMKLGYRQ
jgi:hypothetical protein